MLTLTLYLTRLQLFILEYNDFDNLNCSDFMAAKETCLLMVLCLVLKLLLHQWFELTFVSLRMKWQVDLKAVIIFFKTQYVYVSNCQQLQVDLIEFFIVPSIARNATISFVILCQGETIVNVDGLPKKVLNEICKVVVFHR
jgi:hypothetical protein